MKKETDFDKRGSPIVFLLEPKNRFNNKGWSKTFVIMYLKVIVWISRVSKLVKSKSLSRSLGSSLQPRIKTIHKLQVTQVFLFPYIVNQELNLLKQLM